MLTVVTAADTRFMSRLICLIGSLHRASMECLKSVHVYDLGLTAADRASLVHLDRVQLCQIDTPSTLVLSPKHPAVPVNSADGFALCPGDYRWKPIAIQQSMCRVGTVLWLDAGVYAPRSLSPLDAWLEAGNPFTLGVGDQGWQSTSYPVNTMKLTADILGKRAINAGLIGCPNGIYASVIQPAAAAARDNPRLFLDDGTAGGGVTAGRHDQAVFGAYWLMANLPVYDGRGFTLGSSEVYTCTEFRKEVEASTLLCQARGGSDPSMQSFLRKVR